MHAVHPARRGRGFRIAAVLTLSTAGAVAGVGAASQEVAWAAGPRPAFQLPFPCGQEVRMESFAHAPALDMFRVPTSATEGNPLVAPAAGVVNQSYSNPQGAGNIVQIDHGEGWFTTSIHLQSRAVQEGDRVEQGDLIGRVGHTGETSNGVPHLHFEQAIDKNGDGRADWGGPTPERVVQVFNGTEYGQRNDESSRVTSHNACDGQPPDPDPEPAKTALKYDGPRHVANGSTAEPSAVLTQEGGVAVAGKTVRMALGDKQPQTCTDKTNAQGRASCTIESVDQPLDATATVPLTAEFAGDDTHKGASTSADLKLRYFTGRAYGLSARVLLPGLEPIGVAPQPDTGAVRTAYAGANSVPCVASAVNLVMAAYTGCATVTTTLDPGTIRSASTVQEAWIHVPGSTSLHVSDLSAVSTSRCDFATARTGLNITVGDITLSGSVDPNTVIDLGDGGHLVLNEQKPVADADQGIRVVGARVVLPHDLGQIVLAEANSAVHNCAPQ